jgi:hypothetical protein
MLVLTDNEGEVSRFKARFVAKGCTQCAGLEYTETFSPVIRMASLHVFLANFAAMDLELCQLDIDTAFMYAPITEDVYIRQPLGFSNGTKVCHLKRCMYGLNITTDQMVANLFTKPLLGPALTRHRSAIMGDAEPMQRFTP